MQGEGLRREFLGDRKGKGAADAVKKFVGMNAENALKTKPRDYAADHADIALLRLRNFTVGRKLKDAEVAGKGGLDRVVELLGCLVPFVSPSLHSILAAITCPTGLWLENDHRPPGEQGEPTLMTSNRSPTSTASSCPTTPRPLAPKATPELPHSASWLCINAACVRVPAPKMP